MCRSNVMLIKYYSKKIEMLVEDAGGIDKLNPYQDQILIKYQNVAIILLISSFFLCIFSISGTFLFSNNTISSTIFF